MYPGNSRDLMKPKAKQYSLPSNDHMFFTCAFATSRETTRHLMTRVALRTTIAVHFIADAAGARGRNGSIPCA